MKGRYLRLLLFFCKDLLHYLFVVEVVLDPFDLLIGLMTLASDDH